MKPTVLNLISYSGGKDSGAMALHLIEQGLTNLVLVMCDTQWEHPETMRYAFWFARRVGLRLVLLGSEGMVNMVLRKGRAPSATRRFCTDELKRKPFQSYVHGLHAKGFETVVWVGVRAEESPGRAKQPCDEWDKDYNCLLVRPIKSWTVTGEGPNTITSIHARHNVPWNPLYKAGMGRVGCMPCIMANKEELKAIAERYPEVFDVKLAGLEKRLGRTRFAPGTTPDRFCSTKIWVEASEGKPAKGDKPATEGKPARWVHLATVQDVKAWALARRGRKSIKGEVGIFPVSACQSKYALCE